MASDLPPTVLRIALLDDEPDVAQQSVHGLLEAFFEGDLPLRPPWGPIRLADRVLRVECDLVASPKEARELLQDHSRLEEYSLVLVDNDWHEKQEAKDFGLRLLRDHPLPRPREPIVAIFTAAPSYDHKFAADALALGADALVRKSEETHLLNCLLFALDRASARVQRAQWRALGGALARVDPDLSSSSPVVTEQLRRAAAFAAWGDATVLLQGESGTGKTRLARAMHKCSPRADRPFERVDLAGLPADLVQVELFGSEEGAFTGARARRGILEAANGGTVLVDDVQNLPKPLQKVLALVIEEKVYRRPGHSEREISLDVRFILASSSDLDALVTQGEFDRDLLNRIGGFRVTLPALRDRREDLPVLCRSLLKDIVERAGLGRSVPALSDAAVERLGNHSWPGNIRELRHVLSASLALMRVDAPAIRAEDLEFQREVKALGPQAREWSTTLAVEALRVAPAKGLERRVFELILAAAPDAVSLENVSQVAGEQGSVLSEQGLREMLSRLRRRLRDVGLTIDHDVGASTLSMRRRE